MAEDETRRDYVVDLGRGAVVEEVEQGLVGMSAGETKEMSFELADGSTQSLTATVKEIKEKVLPPLDDDLARAATEFETFAELRADIESRLREQIEDEIETRSAPTRPTRSSPRRRSRPPGRSSSRARASCCAASPARSRPAASRSRRSSP